MLFDVHMICETIAVSDVRTECQALVFFIKPVWAGQKATGGKGSILLENQHLFLSMQRLGYKKIRQQKCGLNILTGQVYYVITSFNLRGA